LSISNELTKDKILLSSFILSEGKFKNFTDIELANKLGLDRTYLCKFIAENKIPEIRVTKKDEISCPNCGSPVSISQELDFAFCHNCNQEINDTPKLIFGLDNEKCWHFLKDKLILLLSDAKISNQEANMMIIDYKSLKLAVEIKTDKAILKDVFVLKGWSDIYNPQFQIIIAPTSDFVLSSQYSKGMTGVLTVEILFDKTLFTTQLNKIEQDIAEREKVQQLNWTYTENQDLVSIEKYWRTFLVNAEKYSAQRGNENATIQGGKFQQYAIDLLRITIFNAKALGGKNKPDGAIFIKSSQRNGKTELIPVEVKTNISGFVPIQEHEPQIRKYLEAFTNEGVTDNFEVSRILIIGPDFQPTKDKELAVINQLEKDFSIKVILMPFRSLARLVNLFFQYQITDINNNRLSDFLRNYKYIEPSNVDELMNLLKVETEEKTKYTFNFVETFLKNRGY
jgi:hypothetical protein